MLDSTLSDCDLLEINIRIFPTIAPNKKVTLKRKHVYNIEFSKLEFPFLWYSNIQLSKEKSYKDKNLYYDRTKHLYKSTLVKSIIESKKSML